jgi:hypothetical protein
MSASASAHTNLSSRLSLGDAASAISTPLTSTANEEGMKTNSSLTKGNVFTFGPESELEPKDDFSVLFEKKMKQGDKSNQILNLRGLFKRKKSDSSFNSEDSPSAASHYESDAGSSEVSDVVRERDRLEESNQINLEEESDGDEYSHREDDASVESNPLLKSDNERRGTEFAFDMMETPDKMTRKIHSRNISAASSTFGRHARNMSSASSHHFHRRNVSEFSMFTTGHLYTFQAPTSGKLGIIIQSRGSSAPTVIQVKDYSPLLGQVKPGDKIVAVDGIDTSQMNTSQITTFLADRRSASIDKENRKMSIRVMSKYRKEGLEPESHIPELIEMKHHATPSDARDDFEVPQTIVSEEKEQSNEFQEKEDHRFGDGSCEAENSSDENDSYHLLGAVDSEDLDDDLQDAGVAIDRDQFL